MTTRPRRARRYGGLEALDALASPARQELLMALDEGGASVRELAARLGRSRSALHYHAAVLERAGLIKSAGMRGAGRARETIFVPEGDHLALHAKKNTPAELDVTRRAGEALLRLTRRELVRALGDIRATGVVVPGALLAARGKARLTRAQLVRVNTLIEELLALVTDAPADPRSSAQLYALTIVLTPSRDANAPARGRRRVR
jgi:DNA-binding transcriptional ArsR family regulator